MNMRSTALAATVAITLSAGPAGAQDGLEIGVWAQPENAIYGEREWRQNVYPYIRWQKDRWKIDGDRASFDLLRAADGGIEFLRLNSAIRHSPIVDAGSRTEGYVGILYRFH